MVMVAGAGLVFAVAILVFATAVAVGMEGFPGVDRLPGLDGSHLRKCLHCRQESVFGVRQTETGFPFEEKEAVQRESVALPALLFHQIHDGVPQGIYDLLFP